MRVDEASHEKKRTETLLLLVYSFLSLFFVLFLTLFVFFFCLFYFSYFLLFCFDYYFLFKPTAILEKSYTLTQTLPFFFPLYVGQPVRTTAAPGRLF